MAPVEHHRHPEYSHDGSPLASKMQHNSSTSPKRQAFKDPIASKLEQNALVLSLKKQVTELRKQNEESKQEINDLKQSTKVCVYNELDVQLEAYSDECKRLRDLLEEAVAK